MLIHNYNLRSNPEEHKWDFANAFLLPGLSVGLRGLNGA
jgi:hypothetical protein